MDIIDKNENPLEKLEKIDSWIRNKLVMYQQEGKMIIPENYNMGNALQHAWLIIEQEDKLKACSKESKAQALLQMVNSGLNPSQAQCYFVPFDKRLKLMVSYFGKQTMLRRLKGVLDVKSQIIFENDEIDYSIEDAEIVNLTHKTNFSNRENKVKGAYCIIKLDENTFNRKQHIEIMNINEIKASWGMGASKGGSKAHINFEGEMAKKTVINRGIKQFVNTLNLDEHNKRPLLETINEIYENEEMYENSNEEIIDTTDDELKKLQAIEDDIDIEDVGF